MEEQIPNINNKVEFLNNLNSLGKIIEVKKMFKRETKNIKNSKLTISEKQNKAVKYHQ